MAPLLEGTDGIEKMSKSNDNYIALTDTPDDMYGKVLSIPDNMILKYFEFCTEINLNELESKQSDFEKGKLNPRDLKRELAREIVAFYYDPPASKEAEQNFDNLFIKKGVPDDVNEFKLNEAMRIIDIMVSNKMVSSNGEAKRMIKQGAVKLDDEKVDNGFSIIEPASNIILKVGKRRFVKLI